MTVLTMTMAIMMTMAMIIIMRSVIMVITIIATAACSVDKVIGNADNW